MRSPVEPFLLVSEAKQTELAESGCNGIGSQIAIHTKTTSQDNKTTTIYIMDSLADFSILASAPTGSPTQRRAKRRHMAAEEDALCSSPSRRQLPSRNESVHKLQEHLEGLQRQHDRIGSKCTLNDSVDVVRSRSNNSTRLGRLSTIYECDDEADF